MGMFSCGLQWAEKLPLFYWWKALPSSIIGMECGNARWNNPSLYDAPLSISRPVMVPFDSQPSAQPTCVPNLDTYAIAVPRTVRFLILFNPVTLGFGDLWFSHLCSLALHGSPTVVITSSCMLQKYKWGGWQGRFVCWISTLCTRHATHPGWTPSSSTNSFFTAWWPCVCHPTHSFQIFGWGPLLYAKLDVPRVPLLNSCPWPAWSQRLPCSCLMEGPKQGRPVLTVATKWWPCPICRGAGLSRH